MLQKAVFLDKDGTLVNDVPFNVNPDLIKLTDGSVEGLRILQKRGYLIIVVSNQSGIARGLFTVKDMLQVEKRLNELLLAGGIKLNGFYYCPHHPEGKMKDYAVICACRKPNPGMLYLAAKEHNINLVASWLVGDILDDIEAGNRAGCRTIMLNNHNETEWKMSRSREPYFIVRNLYEAATVITGSISLEAGA